MDDLQSKIAQVLSDPKSLEQLKGLSDMLTKGNTSGDNNADMSVPFSNNSNDMMAMMSKVAPLLGNMSKDDDATRLLLALRPFLSEQRQEKLDSAQKILKMMKLLPLIKDSNILDSIF